MPHRTLQTLELEDLDHASGGNWFKNAWNAISGGASYAAPPGVGEAAGALAAAPGVITVGKQGQVRNRLINELASGSGNSDATFRQYNNGKWAQRSRNLINQ